MTAQRSHKFVGLQFTLLALAWGSSFLFIKIALDGLNPAQIMVGRLLLGASFLALVMQVTRRRWPRGWKAWRALLLISVFLAVLPFTLYAWAGQHIPSGLSSIYNASTPIATMAFAMMLLPDEKLTRTRLTGLLVGTLGVIVIAAPWTISFDGSATDIVLAQLACLAANASYAFAYVLQRRLLRDRNYDPTTIAASQIVVAAGLGVLVAPFIGGLEPISLSGATLVSIVLLGALGTGVSYIWLNNTIATWGVVAASTVTYFIPAVGVVLGIVLLGEVLHWNEPVGGVIILLGVLITQERLGRRARPAGD